MITRITGTGLNITLRPCPFCGEYPEELSREREKDGYSYTMICGCGARLEVTEKHPLDAAKAVANAWNTRKRGIVLKGVKK